jgi:hypothetical protein
VDKMDLAPTAPTRFVSRADVLSSWVQYVNTLTVILTYIAKVLDTSHHLSFSIELAVSTWLVALHCEKMPFQWVYTVITILRSSSNPAARRYLIRRMPRAARIIADTPVDDLLRQHLPMPPGGRRLLADAQVEPDAHRPTKARRLSTVRWRYWPDR